MTFVRLASLALAMAFSACADSGPTPPDGANASIAMVLSDTVAAANAVAGSQLAATPASAELAYVSVPPGTIPEGVSATIANRRTQASVTTLLVDGGFDPLPIAARANDTLETTVSLGPDRAPVAMRAVVPPRTRPGIVRTVPPRGKADVPLNVRMTVVFSEPIDPASLNSGALVLMRGSSVVSGRIGAADPDGVSVDFVPDASLSAATRYELIVSGSVRDRDGEVLGASVTVEFVTQELSAAIGPIALSVATVPPDNVIRPDDVESGQWIYVLEDSRLTQLTDRFHGWDSCPSWSPDGLKIAFSRGDLNGPVTRVHVMQRDGSGIRELAPLDAAGCPAWSPDGAMLAFPQLWPCADLRPNCGDGQGIYVVNADGSNLRRVTDRTPSGSALTWSPDGKEIAFGSQYCDPGRNCGDAYDGMAADEDLEYDIAIVNVDGSNLRRLSHADEDIWPAWSPDGTVIAFMKGYGIYTMKPDGSEVRKLSGGRDFADFGPSWSPDGSMIAFSRVMPETGTGDIYVMNADGSDVRRLTNSAEAERWPALSPARNP